MNEARKQLLHVENISKTFPGVKALNRVAMDLDEGEILAVLGENGAGKSTLIKIISGVYQPDDGAIIEFCGEPVKFATPKEATDMGIAVVHQELNFCPGISVAENIMMNSHPRTKGGFVDWKTLYKSAQEVLDRLNLAIDPKKDIALCSAAEKQQVEIAKALLRNCKILILDEPTSALNDIETENLFQVLTKLTAEGLGIIYISHKIGEVKRLSERLVILRDGNMTYGAKTADLTEDEIIARMVGRQITDMYPEKTNNAANMTLEVKDLYAPGVFRNVSFNLHKGEILGVYGLMGSGHTALGKVLYGCVKGVSGEIKLNGETYVPEHPTVAVAKGLALVSNERKTEGIVGNGTVQENLNMIRYEKNRRIKGINYKTEHEVADRWIKKLSIKTPSKATRLESLSGGNQQKVILGKWLETKPEVLILTEPTLGIDVGAKSEIYKILHSLCEEGMSIILISSEMPELLAMSNHVIVMHEGIMTGSLDAEQMNEINVMKLAIGGNV